VVRLGIIGAGGMANAHMDRYREIEGCTVAACCDVVPGKAAKFAQDRGVPNSYEDYRAMLDHEALDAVAVVTTDATHAECSLEALGRGLHVLCEKPLATSLEDALRMTEAARASGRINMVNFSYRNSAAVQGAAAAIRAGAIGRVLHVEASYLQSWLVSREWGDWRTGNHLTWRLSTRHGSAGVLGDIGCHIYDMVSYLCGDITEIQCRLRTFSKGEPNEMVGEYALDANDSFVSAVSFSNGAMGAVHSTRWASGQVNSLRARIYGDGGAIDVELDRSWDEYRTCTGQEAIDRHDWRTEVCPPSPNNYKRFITAIKTGCPDPCDFAVGARVQAYLHYSQESDRLGAACPIRMTAG
jgi:predicted dehydrogenase